EDLLEKLGFEIDHFGKTTFRIRGVPVIFGEIQEKEVLHSVIDELSDWSSNSLKERKEEMIKYMACHDSVTAGDKLSITSAKELLEKLGRLENPYTCPHGRPTIVSFAEKEIKKWFKRT
ncbi:MAG: DNA mismatch repair protein MutL, partial [Candidatus Thermoplasmatota archaeon]